MIEEKRARIYERIHHWEERLCKKCKSSKPSNNCKCLASKEIKKLGDKLTELTRSKKATKKELNATEYMLVRGTMTDIEILIEYKINHSDFFYWKYMNAERLELSDREKRIAGNKIERLKMKPSTIERFLKQGLTFKDLEYIFERSASTIRRHYRNSGRVKKK